MRASPIHPIDDASGTYANFAYFARILFALCEWAIIDFGETGMDNGTAYGAPNLWRAGDGVCERFRAGCA